MSHTVDRFGKLGGHLLEGDLTHQDTTRRPVGADHALQFFTPHEARTVEAVMARIFPVDELGPGAVEAGAVYYVDRALAGAEADQQGRYRAEVRSLDALARRRFGSVFADCDSSQQDVLVGHLAALATPDGEVAPEEEPTGQAFFEIIRAHTLEGMFSDPVHGGNRDLVGWKLLGYPGPQPSYSHDEQQLDAIVVRDRIFTAADYPLVSTEEPS